MDRYTKIVLTVIAISLSVIAIRLIKLREAPTLGDLLALQQIKDPTAREQARKDFFNRISVVRVQGGQIDGEVSGTVSIEQ